MAIDPAVQQSDVTVQSADSGRVDQQNVDSYGNTLDPSGVDRSYWIACLEDAERAERDWRERGRQIVEIYRNENRNTGKGSRNTASSGQVTFNVLYANTEVILPAIYSQPPEPVVRSRFVKVNPPAMPPMPPPPLGLGGPPGVPAPGGMPPPTAGPPAIGIPPPAGMNGTPASMPPVPPPGVIPPAPAIPGGAGAGIGPAMAEAAAMPATPPAPPPLPFGGAPGAPPPAVPG